MRRRGPLLGALSAAVLGLTGCTTAPQSAAPAASVDVGSAAAPATIAPATLTQDRLAEMLSEAMAEHEVEAAHVEVTIAQQASATSQERDGAAPAPQTEVGLGTASAALTGTLVLADPGSLPLDSDVADHVPDAEVTASVRDALRMRSGVSSSAGRPFVLDAASSDLVTSLARASGNDLAEAIQQAIADPLDLTGTAWSGASATSSVADLGVLARALAEGDLLPSGTQTARMASLRDSPGDTETFSGTGYGLALAAYGDMVGHPGTAADSGVFFGYDDEADLALVVTTGEPYGGDGAPAAEAIAVDLLQDLGLMAPQPDPSDPVSPPHSAAQAPGSGSSGLLPGGGSGIPTQGTTTPAPQPSPTSSGPSTPTPQPSPTGPVVNFGPYYSEPERVPLTGVENPMDDVLLTAEQRESGYLPALQADGFDCDPRHPECGVASLPTWTAETGYPITDLTEMYPGLAGQVTLADLDGDDWPEMVGVSESWAQIWGYEPLTDQCAVLGEECGRFTPWTMHTFFGIRGTEATLPDGTTTAGWNTYQEWDGVGSFRVGDFDGDGRQEIAARTPGAPGTVKLMDWDPDTETMSLHAVDTAATQHDGQMLVADLDGDGTQEYVIVTDDASYRISWDTGHTAHVENLPSPRTSGIHGPLVAASPDGGPTQVLVASAYDRLTSFALHGGAWQESLLTPIGSIPSGTIGREHVTDLIAQDLTGDGVPEVVVVVTDPRTSSRPSTDSRDVTVIQLPASASDGQTHHWPIWIDDIQDTIHIADLDGDGTSTLLVHARDHDEVWGTDLDVTGDDIGTEILTDQRIGGVGSQYSRAGWILSTSWESVSGADLLIAQHDTGMRVLGMADGALIQPGTQAPAFTGDEQDAFAAISRHVTYAATADLRTRYADTANLKNYQDRLSTMTPAQAPGVPEAAFESVRSALAVELAAASSVATYELHMRDELNVAFSTNAALGRSVIDSLKTEERRTTAAHNNVIALISGVVSVTTSVAGLGVGAVAEEVAKAAATEVQALDATVTGMNRAATLDGAGSASSAVLGFLERSVDDTTYTAAASEVAKKLATVMIDGAAVHDARVAHANSDYALMFATSRVIGSGYWTMPGTQATAYRSILQREADQYVYATILPAVTVTWSCVISGWFAPPACTTNTNPYHDAVIQPGNLKVYLAWNEQELAAGRASTWGWGVPRAVTDKLFTATTSGCVTTWGPECGFGYEKKAFYLAETPIPMECHGLRNQRGWPDWRVDHLADRCLTDHYWSE